jgi:hypothetical protein
MTRKPDREKIAHDRRDADEARREPPKPVYVVLAEPHMEMSKRLVDGPRVGRGGTAVITRVFDTNLLRHVAKKSPLDNKGYEDTRGRLIEEAQITSQLDHPNIVPVHELGCDDDGDLFFTMKLVRGRTLSALLEAEPPEQRTKEDLFSLLQIFLKVCDAVAFAHSRGVIHRDLKPDNIMVGDFGAVYLMDWGLAKLKETPRPSKRDTEMPIDDDRIFYESMDEEGFLRGTVYYMAPEQARGDFSAIDERTDVFLLGGVLYKILTQSAPYYGEPINHLIVKAQQATIAAPKLLVEFDLPQRLCDIAMKALRKDPEDRYQSVVELKEDVESFLQFGWQFKRRVFSAGTLIVKEGEPGDTAYIIKKGRCQVYRNAGEKKQVLSEIGDGDVFGEIAVFTRVRRTATVEAMEQVTAMEITRDDLERDLGMSDWLGQLIAALAERYREKDRRVAELEEGGKNTHP